MLTSFDRTTWKEDPFEDAARDALDINSDPALARKLYPFVARANKRLAMYQIEEGTIFTYARVKHEPGLFPIEIKIGIAGEQKALRKIYASSDEATVMVP